MTAGFLSSYASAAEPETFAGVRATHLRAAVLAVAEYVREHPDAADTNAARRWLFETALEHGLEREALPAASEFLDGRSNDDRALRTLTQRVRGVGLAKAGRLEEALASLEAALESASFREPDATMDFALAMVAEAQLANETAAARAILERVARTFLLHPFIKPLCEERLLKLELAGQAAPEITVADLQGESVELAAYQGKVVLVDFWATNCPPCLEEFPALQQLYQQQHPRGFEIVGISLDEERGLIDEFQTKWQLPWGLALSSSDNNATRQRYRASKIPSLFVLGRDGKVRYVDVRGDALRRGVESLLAEE